MCAEILRADHLNLIYGECNNRLLIKTGLSLVSAKRFIITLDNKSI